MTKGYVHSFQSMGAVDGPGLRCVVFMRGCPLRCMYCHNPDTWDMKPWISNPLTCTGDERETEPEALVQKILRFRPYFKETGGVTVSGGEPLLQQDFVGELFRKLQAEGVHTALDTSGSVPVNNTSGILASTDLVICDIKFATEEEYSKYCGGSLREVLNFLRLTEAANIPLWIRHVVVPGYTDSESNIDKIVALATGFSNLERIELLPFHKMCMKKYEELGIDFPLAEVPPCSDARIAELSERIPKEF